MRGDFSRIVINEVPDAVMRNAPEFRPLAECADRWFFAYGENSAQAKSEDVRELILTG